MFIILYLIFTIVYVHSKSIEGTNRQQFDFIDSVLRYNESALKTETKNVTTIPKFSMLLDNLNKRTNLKLSVFEKMLSDEMFSIKKNIHDKDVTLTPHVNLSATYIASTPTLEIKQKWLSTRTFLFARENKEKVTNKNSENIKINDSTEKNNLKNITNISLNAIRYGKNKVIGVRSFTDHVRHETNHDQKKCSCMRANMHTSCTSRCSASVDVTEIACTRSTFPICTRTPYPFYPYFAYTYVAPYLEITTSLPSEIDYLSHKHHKTKKPYHPEYDPEEFINDDENKEIDERETSHTNKYVIDYGSNNGENNNNNYYYDDYNNNEKYINKDALDKGYLQVDKERLISNIIDDLKVHYNDAVIKDCYCSSWSNIFQIKYFTVYIIIFITVFI